MSALPFPCTIFKTQNRMDDDNAKDMRCGDLSASQLKTHYGLNYLSDRVDPWTLTRRPVLDSPRSRYCCNMRPTGEKVSREQCAAILFDEFRQLSRQFSLCGPYRHLIEKMINHMQYGKGKAFRDMSLDRALKEQILNDRSKKNSPRVLLEKTFKDKIDWENKFYPLNKKDELLKAIFETKLPEFDRFQDKFNGMGITVHDTWATHITIKSLQIDNDRYRAVVHYKVQDHFGLDDEDIFNKIFGDFNFFRIWFVLQRYNKFGFKPFMTNMEASVEITGSRYEI
ncbi:YPO3983 family protein [Erwinia mallotivora]|uniref:YPO3983 family protein n=1 Tax=Erwinia mallotivora TaxID=69222 RepID=UPI0035F0F45B